MRQRGAGALAAAGFAVVLVAGLVVWRSVDPPTVVGSAVPDAARTAVVSDDPGPETSTMQTTQTTQTTRSTTPGTTSTRTTPSLPPRMSGSSSTLTLGLQQQQQLPTDSDPAHSYGGPEGVIWHQSFETLTRYERGEAAPQPGLADRWTPSADRRKWMLEIADGHTFGGKQSVTAADVCANFDTWNSADQAEQGLLGEWVYWFHGFDGDDSALYSSCDADGRTVILFFSAAMPALPDILTDPAFSAQAPDSMGTDRPLGSGPYVLTSTSADEVVLEAVDAAADGPTEVQVRPIGDPGAGQAAVASGELDLFLPSGSIGSGGPAGVMDPQVQDEMTSLHLFAGHGPLADPDVRAAAVAAVDREAVARLLGAETADGPFPGVLQIDPTREAVPEFDPAAARKLLQGKMPTLTFARRTFSGPAAQEVTSLVAQQLAAGGFTVKTVEVDNAADYYEQLQAGKFDVSIDRLAAIDTDAADWLQVYLKNALFSGVVPKKNQEKSVRAMTSAQAMTDRGDRQEKATAVMGELVVGGSVLPLYASGSGAVVGATVQGFELAPFSRIELADLEVG